MKFDETYIKVLQHIMDNGTRKQNRTGIDTLSVFNTQICAEEDAEGYNNIPLSNLRKVYFKGALIEVLWILGLHMKDERYSKLPQTNTRYLLDQGVKYWQHWEEPNSKNHFRKSLSITPNVNDGELTKLFDTRNAVMEAMNNNDLVIVAGDGSNDFKMLNPLEYIPSADWVNYAKDSNCPEFYLGDMKKKLRDLRHLYKGYDDEYTNELRKELQENGFLKRLQDMPFVGIVIKKDKSKLKKLVDTFASSGKIVEIDKGQLDEGVKKAVKKYAEINQNFRNDMSDNLKYVVGYCNQTSLEKEIVKRGLNESFTIE